MTGNVEGEHNVKLVGVISNKRGIQKRIKAGGGVLEGKRPHKFWGKEKLPKIPKIRASSKKMH